MTLIWRPSSPLKGRRRPDTLRVLVSVKKIMLQARSGPLDFLTPSYLVLCTAYTFVDSEPEVYGSTFFYRTTVSCPALQQG